METVWLLERLGGIHNAQKLKLPIILSNSRLQRLDQTQDQCNSLTISQPMIMVPLKLCNTQST